MSEAWKSLTPGLATWVHTDFLCSADQPGGLFPGRGGVGRAGRAAGAAPRTAVVPRRQRRVRNYCGFHAHLWDLHDG